MKRLGTSVLVVMAVLLCGRPGQGAEIKDLISGQMFPLTLQLKDLDSEWRLVTLGGLFEMGDWARMFASMSRPGGASTGGYYTKGQTVTVGDDTFLVAYRAPAKPFDITQMFERGPAAMPAEKLTPETSLSVSFLNLKGLTGLGGVRPFDLAREIAEPEALSPVTKRAQESEDRATSLSNLRQVMLAALMYAADNKDTLPPMKSAAEIEKALTPYVKSKDLFVNPVDCEPYRANVLLSGKKVAHIKDPAQMIVFYEAAPAADGRRGAAFLDGHVRLLSPGDWERCKKISKIP